MAQSAPHDAPQSRLEIKLAFISRIRPPSPPFELDPPPPGEGFDGAKLAIEENQTTGAFLGQTFALENLELGPDEDPVAAIAPALAQGTRIFISALSADETRALAQALAPKGAILLNAAAPDDVLRGEGCLKNLFHTAPSRAMLTDALAQYFVLRRWTKIALVLGAEPGDAAYAQAFRASARKFGLKITAEKAWTFGPLARARSDSVTMAEALTFSRNFDADLLVVADEGENFGDYIMYRTAEPRLVAGTQGLIATSWSPTHTAYGAEQLQNRFIRLAHRRMRPIDYQAWIAARAIGEAVTETGSAEAETIAAAFEKPEFSLAVFKGAAGSFRPWDGQFREGVVLTQPRSMIGLSPQPGFLHQFNVLDTLGVDARESACRQHRGS